MWNPRVVPVSLPWQPVHEPAAKAWRRGSATSIGQTVVGLKRENFARSCVPSLGSSGSSL